MNTITEEYINKCIKMTNGKITEHTFNQKMYYFHKLNAYGKSKLQIYKCKYIGQDSNDNKPAVVDEEPINESPSLITQNFCSKISPISTPNLSYSHETNTENESSSFDNDNAFSSSLDYDQSSSTDNINDNNNENKYQYPWSSDSDDSYADLNEYQTMKKLQYIIDQRAQLINNYNEKPAKIAEKKQELQDKNKIFPKRNGRYLTMIIVDKYLCDADYDADYGVEMSLNDVSSIFLKKVGHSPHSMQQMVAFCKQNNYGFNYKEINMWWPNRPNPTQKPKQKPVNVYQYHDQK